MAKVLIEVDRMKVRPRDVWNTDFAACFTFMLSLRSLLCAVQVARQLLLGPLPQPLLAQQEKLQPLFVLRANIFHVSQCLVYMCMCGHLKQAAEQNDAYFQRYCIMSVQT